jgi:hypothetical protein
MILSRMTLRRLERFWMHEGDLVSRRGQFAAQCRGMSSPETGKPPIVLGTAYRLPDRCQELGMTYLLRQQLMTVCYSRRQFG